MYIVYCALYSTFVVSVTFFPSSEVPMEMDFPQARPLYLKELTPITLPGSRENWTQPDRFVRPLFTRKELLFFTSCQIRSADMCFMRKERERE